MVRGKVEEGMGNQQLQGRNAGPRTPGYVKHIWEEGGYTIVTHVITHRAGPPYTSYNIRGAFNI